jgi:hypothetical protein
VRRVSEEFDNRIKGSLWVDDIRLTRNPSAEH